jgi:hypothetical protein
MRGESLWTRFLWWLAWKLPRRLVYFCHIRLWAWATTGRYGDTRPDELSWDEACKRWETPPASGRWAR